MFGNHHGVPDSGYGYIMDVYADRVEFKARNFSLRRYNGDFDYTVKLK